VNYAGERRVLTGLAGETLLAVAQRHKYSFVDGACGGGGAPSEKLHKEGNWLEPKYGEGASCYFCHVVVAKAFAHTLPPVRQDEEEQLQQYPFKEDMSETSRLACQISLTKACVDWGARSEGGLLRACAAGSSLGAQWGGRLQAALLGTSPFPFSLSPLHLPLFLSNRMEGMMVFVPDGPPSDMV
jgi:ferredoxin